MAKETILSGIRKNDTELFPGEISCYQGNVGGISYGIYHFASNVGVPQSFVGWLNKKGHPYGRMLSKFAAGTREFSCCWQYIGEHDPEEFRLLQDDFVKTNYFMPTVERLKAEFGLDIINNGYAELQEIIWLMAVEFGPARTVELVRNIQSSELVSSTGVSQIDETRLIELVKATLDTAEWLEARKDLVSGLCLPSKMGYLQSKNLNKVSA